MLCIEIEAFLTSRRAKGCKESTVLDYGWKLRQFADWVGDGDWCSADAVEAFLVDVRGRGLAAHSVDAFYRSLRVFFRWYCRRRKKGENPIEEIERPLVPKKRPRTIPAADVWRLLESLQGDGWPDRRDRLLVLLLFSTGIRRGEAAGLHVTDFSRERNTLHIRNGKGGDREIPLVSEIRPALLDYLMARPAWSGPEVFLSDNGAGGVRGVLSGEGIRQMLRRRCGAAGVAYYNPHSFRHGAAVALLNDGHAQMSFIQALLGHSDIRTTQAFYARWRLDGLSEQQAAAWAAIRGQ